MQKVTLNDSFGNPVQAILSVPPNAQSVVIMSHGFTSNKDSKLYVELEELLNNAGIGTVRYDYFGHGPAYGYEGRYGASSDTTLSKALESLKAIINYLKEKENYKIGLLGSSFGGLVSLVTASQDTRIKALVLKSSVTKPKQFWSQRLGKAKMDHWRENETITITQDVVDYDLKYQYWLDLQKYDSLKMAKSISCPVLIVHGKEDTCVPIKQSEDLADVLNMKVNAILGANHDYSGPGQYEEMKSAIFNFLINKLSS